MFDGDLYIFFWKNVYLGLVPFFYRVEYFSVIKFYEMKWMKFAQSCPTLCDPMHHAVHGILQARILEWVALPFSRGSFQPRDRTQVSHIVGGFFTNWATREDGRQKEKRAAEDEMLRYHHQLNRHESEQTPGGSRGQRSLVCCSVCGCKESDMTERMNNKTLMNTSDVSI